MAPGDIKSALMTTSYNTLDGAGNPFTDPFAQGAGHVDPTAMFEPGLVYSNDTSDWQGYLQPHAPVSLASTSWCRRPFSHSPRARAPTSRSR
ncbi:hypothetical protein JOF34_000616 [Microbacterium amylolyticum]|uniref:Uncharacterized protein n=1 Tax=Microbacterium amylolyticum TaxID=936337 RepID=A0ABS4ZFH5_9MICO|nr:hypothetical protein [Microbacterium amylolyticum]